MKMEYATSTKNVLEQRAKWFLDAERKHRIKAMAMSPADRRKKIINILKMINGD